jgi:hypothetical protein
MGAQTVGVFETKQSWLRHDFPQRTIPAAWLRQALPGRIEQFSIERLFIKGLPYSVAANRLDGPDSSLAASPLFRQCLDELQRMEAICIGGGPPEIWARTPRRRQEEPAINGTLSSRPVVMNFASLQLSSRCLSMNTGTT